MFIVSIGASKGGVGKTTLALNLAVEAARRGLRVWLVDADMQGSASTALAERARAEREPTIATAHYTDADSLRAQLKAQAGSFDLVLVDAGGRDSKSLRVALALSQLVLVPFQPRSIDVWALEHMADLVQQLRDAGGQIEALAVLNLADIQGQDNRDAAAAVVSFPALEYLDCPIKRRKAFANAAGEGLGVAEHEPGDHKARAEIEALYLALIRRIGGLA
ncbi:MAG: AAA family ATPase [Burkholderiaceae bacterium]|nr:AAA family ATPase [Burkholderiaceae bacterium]